MDTISKELGFEEWTKKVCERITVVHTSIIDKKKIEERDYNVLEVLHGIWYDGEMPFYHKVMKGDTESVSGNSLFNDKEADKKE